MAKAPSDLDQSQVDIKHLIEQDVQLKRVASTNGGECNHAAMLPVQAAFTKQRFSPTMDSTQTHKKENPADGTLAGKSTGRTWNSKFHFGLTALYQISDVRQHFPRTSFQSRPPKLTLSLSYVLLTAPLQEVAHV